MGVELLDYVHTLADQDLIKKGGRKLVDALQDGAKNLTGYRRGLQQVPSRPKSVKGRWKLREQHMGWVRVLLHTLDNWKLS